MCEDAVDSNLTLAGGVAVHELLLANGHRCAEEWLARITGVGYREAAGTLGASEQLEDLPQIRQALVNGILWTAHVEVPEGGAPCAITPRDMQLPPDTRKTR